MDLSIYETDFSWNGTLSKRLQTDLLVLHHRAGSGDVMSLHQAHLSNGWQGIGYHFYIRKDGTVYRGRPIECVGAHTSGYNHRSIGLCFEGNFEIEDLPEKAKEAGIKLISLLEESYGSNLSILRHKDLTATACPGRYFPFYDLISHQNTAEIIADNMIKDGVTTEENRGNWEAFLSGSAIAPSSYIRTILTRYHEKMKD